MNNNQKIKDEFNKNLEFFKGKNMAEYLAVTTTAKIYDGYKNMMDKFEVASINIGKDNQKKIDDSVLSHMLKFKDKEIEDIASSAMIFGAGAVIVTIGACAGLYYGGKFVYKKTMKRFPNIKRKLDSIFDPKPNVIKPIDNNTEPVQYQPQDLSNEEKVEDKKNGQ